MTGRRPAARMQQIEVDDPDLEGAPALDPHDNGWPHHGAAHRDGSDDGTPSPVRSRRRRWWWVAAAALALAVAAAALVSAARDRAYVARVGAVPGLVRPLDGAPTVAWRAPGVPDADGVVASGDALVLVSETLEGWVATSHDAATGAARWSATLGPPQRAGFESSAAWCPSDGGDVGPTILCLVTRPGVLYSRAAIGEPPVRTRVVALSASHGTRLGAWEVPQSMVGADRVGDDLVVGWVDEGRVMVERRDGVTGNAVWRYRSPSLLPVAGSGGTASVRVDGAVVVVDDGSTAVLDGADGDVLLTGPRFRGLQVASVGDHFATWASVGGGHMYDRDGETLYDVPGLPVRALVDDGSTDDVVVLDDGKSLSAIDAGTGEPRWSVEQALDVQSVVAHRLLVSGLTHYGVVDAGDGKQKWSFDVGQQVPWLPISDGSLVLGPAIDDAGAPMLVGLGLDDGTRFWAVSLPSHVQRVVGVGGRLVVQTATETVVLH